MVTFLIFWNSMYNIEWLGLRWLDHHQHGNNLKLNVSIYYWWYDTSFIDMYTCKHIHRYIILCIRVIIDMSRYWCISYVRLSYEDNINLCRDISIHTHTHTHTQCLEMPMDVKIYICILFIILFSFPNTCVWTYSYMIVLGTFFSTLIVIQEEYIS